MKISGRFSTVVKRNGWPEELALASQRFGEDYLAAKRAEDAAAILVVELVQRQCHEEDFVYFTVWSAFGESFSEMHKRGWGSTAAISAAVFRAAEAAHAVYSGKEKKEPSRFQIEAAKLLRELTID
ncbi:hypothetical protein [Pleomorphomonas carboxyditropha]|uniref:Uncharacterized protein n=1 Tax=Pleomorphomonas carboxyditropha TaxID=2023338 RepID=A0A2G9WRS3_9HYPH|nr:hypothetical protein [Pleomorphomonas carboxyditropha]PIO96840.1 hypothetical protein CJ014_23605 [Pleomorphomonas carboxyditropha]